MCWWRSLSALSVCLKAFLFFCLHLSALLLLCCFLVFFVFSCFSVSASVSSVSFICILDTHTHACTHTHSLSISLMLSLSVSLISLVSLCLSACLSVCSLWDAVACAFVGEIEGTRGEGGRGGGGGTSAVHTGLECPEMSLMLVRSSQLMYHSVPELVPAIPCTTRDGQH